MVTGKRPFRHSDGPSRCNAPQPRPGCLAYRRILHGKGNKARDPRRHWSGQCRLNGRDWVELTLITMCLHCLLRLYVVGAKDTIDSWIHVGSNKLRLLPIKEGVNRWSILILPAVTSSVQRVPSIRTVWSRTERFFIFNHLKYRLCLLQPLSR